MKEKHLKLRAIPADPNSNGGNFQRAHDVLGWRMAQRAAESPLLAGDVLDLAFTVDYNEHPDFGGVQLSLVDYKRAAPAPLAASKPDAT
jgi:single-stranded-DNA-specific exonuclease